MVNLTLLLVLTAGSSCNLSDVRPKANNNSTTPTFTIGTNNRTNNRTNNVSNTTNNTTNSGTSGQTTNTVVPDLCGNNLIDEDEGEDCDRDNLNGAKCVDFEDFVAGSIRCTETCDYNFDDCLEPLETCSELAGCVIVCNSDIDCAQGCVARTNDLTVVDEYNHLGVCAAENNCQDIECIQQFCEQEYDDCF